jgi:hypothetical protein
MLKKTLTLAAASILAASTFSSTASAQYASYSTPQAQYASAGAAVPTRLIQGSNFRYALPDGWFLKEEGPYALVMGANDQTAMVIVYGMCGLQGTVTPEQFVFDYMSNQLKLENVRLLASQPIQPNPGCAAAAVTEVSYEQSGVRGRARVTTQVAVGAGQSNVVTTIAAAREELWDAYQTWLPQVAAQAVNTGPNAYGSGTMARVNAQIASDWGRAVSDYNGWSQNLQNDVAADRARSQARMNDARGEILTGKWYYTNPYGGSPTYQSSTPAAQWMDPNGNIVTSDNSTYDPRTPDDQDWRRMERLPYGQ